MSNVIFYLFFFYKFVKLTILASIFFHFVLYKNQFYFKKMESQKKMNYFKFGSMLRWREADEFEKIEPLSTFTNKRYRAIRTLYMELR